MRILLASIFALGLVTLSGCGRTPVPQAVLDLKVAGTFDNRASEVCTEAVGTTAQLVASRDATAGEIRQFYEQGSAIVPGSIDALPVDRDSYAALCVYDSTDLPGAEHDYFAYWVSYGDDVGGAILLSSWDAVR